MATSTGTGNATGTGNRDARRRRIVDRGSDRFALITGRIQTLPTPLASPPPEASSAHSSFAASDEPHPIGSLHGEEKLAETLLPKLLSDFDAPESSFPKENSGSEGTSEQASSKTSTENSPLSNPEPGRRKFDTPDSRSTSPRPSRNVHPPNLPAKIIKLINPSQLRSAIATSTNERLLCALAGGLLVVLSSIDFPILGWWFFRVIVTFRPLYLVLITNVTIVAQRMLSNKQSGHNRTAREDSSSSPNDETGWADQVGASVELGLLLMNVLDAIVMDCTFYAAVVVCGLSLFGRFVL